MRAALLGEYRADRLASALREAGAEVIALGFGDLRPCFVPDVVCAELPADLNDETLVSLLERYGADVAIPNMSSPGQEQMLPIYSRVGPRWAATGRHMLVHPEKFAVLATDKVAFHEIARQRGWPVPQGEVCQDAPSLLAALGDIGLPALVKEARSESHAGRHFIEDRASLDRVSSELRYPVLLQQAITGEEYAVELLTQSARAIVWPAASLGTLDSNCAPGKRVRVEPAGLPDRAEAALVDFIRDIVATYEPDGPWQMDLAVSGDDLYVIELNGRLGGLSNMSWVSTQLDPHRTHVDAVLGRPLIQPQPTQVALELPVYNEFELPPVPAGLELAQFTGSATNPVPLATGYYRAVLGVPADGADAAEAWLRSLDPGLLLAEPAEAISQLARGVQALRQGEAQSFARALDSALT